MLPAGRVCVIGVSHQCTGRGPRLGLGRCWLRGWCSLLVGAAAACAVGAFIWASDCWLLTGAIALFWCWGGAGRLSSAGGRSWRPQGAGGSDLFVRLWPLRARGGRNEPDVYVVVRIFIVPSCLLGCAAAGWGSNDSPIGSLAVFGLLSGKADRFPALGLKEMGKLLALPTGRYASGIQVELLCCGTGVGASNAQVGGGIAFAEVQRELFGLGRGLGATKVVFVCFLGLAGEPLYRLADASGVEPI